MEKVFHEKGALDGDPRAVLPASTVPLPPKPSRTDSPGGSAESRSVAVCRDPRSGCETSALAFGAAEITVVASSPLVVRPVAFGCCSWAVSKRWSLFEIISEIWPISLKHPLLSLMFVAFEQGVNFSIKHLICNLLSQQVPEGTASHGLFREHSHRRQTEFGNIFG